MTDTPKTLSRAYTFNRKVYTPHSTDVPQELLDRDAEWLAAKAARQDAEGEEGAEAVAAPRARGKRAKKK